MIGTYFEDGSRLISGVMIIEEFVPAKDEQPAKIRVSQHPGEEGRFLFESAFGSDKPGELPTLKAVLLSDKYTQCALLNDLIAVRNELNGALRVE